MSARATLADRGYRPYTGPLTPPSRRFLVVARRMVRLWLSQRSVTLLLVVGLLPPLITGIVMAVTGQIAATTGQLHQQPSHYVSMVLVSPWGQLLFASLLALYVAAPAIAEDVERHSLPFYLARPLSAQQYLAGKALAAATLLGGITVAPSLLLAIESMALCERSQLGAALLLLPRAAVAALLLLVGVLAPALALSAWAQRRTHAQVIFGVALYLPWMLNKPLTSLAQSWWPRLLAWPAIVAHVARAAIGGAPTDAEGPLAPALLVYVVVVVGSVLFARRRLERAGGG